MVSNFKNFKARVRPDQYVTSEGRRFDATVCISFFDENNKEQAYHELAYYDTEAVYRLIDEQKPVILDECYIEDFSLTGYRKSRNLEEKSTVTLNNFSARFTYFDSKIETDFSYAFIDGEDISFQESRFINGRVSFHMTQFSAGAKNFSYIIFKNGEVDFSNTKFNSGNIDFKNTIFLKGTKKFQYADFGNGNVSFINTDFGEGEVNFINTHFGKGNTSFKAARFKAGKIDFEFARFGIGDISFERTEFGDGKVDYRKVEFSGGRLNFNRASFGNGDVTFEGSELTDSRITFKKTDFGTGNLFFEDVEFGSSEVLFEGVYFNSTSLNFGKSSFKKLALISCQMNAYVDFRVNRCTYLDLSDSIARDIVDFSSYDHIVRIDCLNLTGMRLVGQIYIDWFENNVSHIINSQKESSYAEKAEQFRILKENYGHIGNYKSEDLAYIQFKRNEQKSILKKSLGESKLNGLWQLPLFVFKFIVVDRMGLYATSPARVILSLLIIYSCFSLIHLTFPFLINTSISCIAPDDAFIDKILNTLL